MTNQQSKYRRLKEEKRARELRQPKKLFREGSKTGDLAFLLVEKGFDGHLTDEDIKRKICGDLMSIPNKYERQIKVSMRIRALIRDIRMKFGVWIGKVWIPEISDFAWKVLISKEDFNQLIQKVADSIERMETLKHDFVECRDSDEYKARVRSFFEDTF